MYVQGKFTKYSYEFLRDLARSYDVKDRRFFNTRELQEEVNLLEPTLTPEVVEAAHAKAQLHVELRRRQSKGVAKRMRSRGYDPNRARNVRRMMEREERSRRTF